MNRDWRAVNNVVRLMTRRACAACGRPSQLERAHIIGRGRDRRQVAPDSIALLCGPTPAGCHGAYDAGRLDLWEHLTDAQRRQAVLDAGGPGLALRRVSAPLWRSPATADVSRLDERLRHLEQLISPPMNDS